MAKQKIEVVIDGKNNATPAIKQAGNDLSGFSRIATSAASTIAGVLSVGTFAGWIKGSIEAAANIQMLAQVANASTDQFQQWAIGARTVGIDQEKLADILKDTNDKVGDFLQTGGGELQDFFKGIAPQIGITAEQFRGLSGPDALQLYVSSLEKAGVSQAEMVFYLEAIADDATKLLPLLRDGGAGMAAWAAEAQSLGLILSQDTIAQAKAFNDQMSLIGVVSGNIGSQMAAEMLPALSEMAGLLLDVAKDSESAQVAADAFGIVLKGVATVAIGLGSTIGSLGRGIGGLAAAAKAAAGGDLAAAGEIVRQVTRDNQASADEAEARIRKLWSGEYQKAGQRAAKVNQKVADSQNKVVKTSKDYQDQQDAAKKKAEAAAKVTEQLAKQQQDYVAGLEKQAATLGLTAAQVRAYEVAEKNLAGALDQRAKAALATLAAYEQQQQALENARANADLQADILRAQGREADAAMLEIQTKYAQMRRQFEKDGNGAGLSLIDQLIPVEQARARLDQLQSQVDKVLAEQQRQEQSINVQQDAGLMTEMEARQRILDIHRQTYEQLQQIRPLLEAMAQQPGAVGQAAANALSALNDQATTLQATTSLLGETLRNGVENGLSQALGGLATGTMNLGQAITSLAQTVVQAMAQMAANSLAQSAMGGLTKLLGGAGGSAGGGFMSMLGGLFGGGAAVAAATGGHVTGPGTTTSDSIPAMLSNWEYVTRAAVVQQPGALDFLHAFNARGMAALDDYARRVRHATGGLAGIPAPALPPPSLGIGPLASPAASMGATVQNAINLYAVQDEAQVASMAWSKPGQDHFMVFLQRNAQMVRSVLKVK